MITLDEFKKKHSDKCRLIGLDLGSKRIGVSICDEKQLIATPLKTINRNSLHELISELKVIIDENDISTDKVSILSKVKIENVKLNKSFEYVIVSEEEANLQEGKISVESPIGKGLLGKKKGEKVTVKIPSGEVIFKIIDISL